MNDVHTRQLFVVFDGSPGPVGPHFIEVEDADGHGVDSGAEWTERDDGYWQLGPFRYMTTPTELKQHEPRRWTIAVCPECNEVELWSESVVVYCGTCGRRLVDDAVEVVEATPAVAEIKRLNEALDAHIGVERSLLDHALVVEPELERLRKIEAAAREVLHESQFAAQFTGPYDRLREALKQ